MNEIERLTVAYHEAGHVCAFSRFRIQFESVTVPRHPAPGEHWGMVRSLPSRASPLNYAASCLAGAAAESRFSSEPIATLLATSARSDHQTALNAIGLDQTSSFEAALHLAKEIVAEDWRGIGKLARTLTAVEVLDCRQVGRILKGVRGLQPRAHSPSFLRIGAGAKVTGWALGSAGHW